MTVDLTIESLVSQLTFSGSTDVSRADQWKAILVFMRTLVDEGEQCMPGHIHTELFKAWQKDLVSDRNEDIASALSVLSLFLHHDALVCLFSDQQIKQLLVLVAYIMSAKNASKVPVQVQLATFCIASHRIPNRKLICDLDSTLLKAIMRAMEIKEAEKVAIDALSVLFEISPAVACKTSQWFHKVYTLLYSSQIEIRKSADNVLNAVAPYFNENDLATSSVR
jgi:hypothetical protein